MAFKPYYYVIKYPKTRSKKPAWLAPLLLGIGSLTLLWVGMPILRYQLIDAPRFTKQSFVSPETYRFRPSVYSSTGEGSDLTKPENWFASSDNLELTDTIQPAIAQFYTLSIPKLRINQARVQVGGEDLSQNLIHYSGTTLPGKPGSAVVFGHSILPQFYNPKNYMSIFSTMHTLKKGDAIFLNYDGITYQYQVEELYEVKPTDIDVLDQDYNDKYLLLITCTPPGTYLRRLVVKSKLVPIQIDEI